MESPNTQVHRKVDQGNTRNFLSILSTLNSCCDDLRIGKPQNPEEASTFLLCCSPTGKPNETLLARYPTIFRFYLVGHGRQTRCGFLEDPIYREHEVIFLKRQENQLVGALAFQNSRTSQLLTDILSLAASNHHKDRQ